MSCSGNSTVHESIEVTQSQTEESIEVNNILQLKINYYREENAKLEPILRKLKLLDGDNRIVKPYSEMTEQLIKVQQKFNTSELSANGVTLSHACMLKKQNKYSAKIKMCTKIYIELNFILTKNIKKLKCEYEKSQKQVNGIASLIEDMKTIEIKIQKYENELIKMEKKYPWLNSNELSLPNISKEINLLCAVKKKKEELVKELSVYSGLKPDLDEANEQLCQIKTEYDELSYNLLN